MIRRFNSGSDVAMVGAWDVVRSAERAAQGILHLEALQQDAAAGELFLVNTRADGDWPVDVVIEEEIPAVVRRRIRTADRGFLLRLPTGRLRVGGLEDYRTLMPQIPDDFDVIQLPPGDYLLRCHVAQNEENWQNDPLDDVLSAEDVKYYRERGGRPACIGGCLLFVVAVVVLVWFGAKEVAVAALIGVLACAGIDRKQRQREEANQRYVRICEVLRELEEKLPPLIFELTPLPRGHNAQGGSVDLADLYGRGE